MKENEFIKETFLRLTNRTYPYGFEEVLAEELIRVGLFPADIQKDKHGNYFYKIGESRTVFTSHLDTACKDHTPVNHVFENNIIKSDGTTILGADDKAGMSIMLLMIKKNIPGVYYFFIGEEVGCVGSGLASKLGDFKGKYDRIVSFDRKGTDSVITFQSGQRCCSEDFAKALSSELNTWGFGYKPDNTGVYTDSAEFVDIISECTNISVGYYKEHTFREHQDIEHLARLAEACCLVKWENLPTVRDPKKTECKSYSYDNWTCYGEPKTWRKTSGSSYNDPRWDREYDEFKSKKNKKKEKSYGYHDDWYDQTPVDTNRQKPRGLDYYDRGNGELERVQLDKSTKYDWSVDIFAEPFTRDELEVIRTQYLDMGNSDDQLYYSFLKQSVEEKDRIIYMNR
jgi:hypothetical protein